MTTRTPAAIQLRAGHSPLYPGRIVTAEHVPARFATPHPAVIECADGSGATAALALTVDRYVMQKHHPVIVRRRLLRPVDTARTARYVELRLPAT